MADEERKREKDMMPTFPADDIICKDCDKKRDGKIGFKNAYCQAFPKGKPNGILFNGEDCGYYKKGR